ncbi:zf-HC2 domain-containing protein [bacterium]|nr:zf-HC2 domain-containing protein [bacterium]MBU1072985.1 zf-HC2 domain-containing protein [bacterium]MBU1677049.1 zf-HC2 domain-containing protein [bacterium]
MRCEDLRDKLTAYLDGELPETESEGCDTHLAACESCADLVAVRRNERDRWRAALRETAPDDLRQEILDGSSPRRTVRFERKHSGRRSLWTAWAAAAVLAVIVLGQVIARLDGSRRPAGGADAFSRPGAVALVVDGEILGAFTELEEDGLVLEGGFL